MGAPFSRVPKFVIEIASTSGGGGGAELPRISEETSSASEPQPPLDVSATAGSKAAHVHVDEQEEGEEKQVGSQALLSFSQFASFRRNVGRFIWIGRRGSIVRLVILFHSHL